MSLLLSLKADTQFEATGGGCSAGMDSSGPCHERRYIWTEFSLEVWTQEPVDLKDCYGVAVKFSPQARVFEPLVSSRWRCFRRLLKLWEAGRAWLADVDHVGRILCS